MMGSQSDILFHEILNIQKILFGWTTFFFLALKFGRNSWRKRPYMNAKLRLRIYLQKEEFTVVFVRLIKAIGCLVASLGRIYVFIAFHSILQKTFVLYWFKKIWTNKRPLFNIDCKMNMYLQTTSVLCWLQNEYEVTKDLCSLLIAKWIWIYKRPLLNVDALAIIASELALSASCQLYWFYLYADSQWF